MVPIYIISMAIAFSFYFGGAQVFFWYKYLIAFLWAISYLGVCVFLIVKPNCFKIAAILVSGKP